MKDEAQEFIVLSSIEVRDRDGGMVIKPPALIWYSDYDWRQCSVQATKISGWRQTEEILKRKITRDCINVIYSKLKSNHILNCFYFIIIIDRQVQWVFRIIKNQMIQIEVSLLCVWLLFIWTILNILSWLLPLIFLSDSLIVLIGHTLH